MLMLMLSLLEGWKTPGVSALGSVRYGVWQHRHPILKPEPVVFLAALSPFYHSYLSILVPFFPACTYHNNKWSL